MAVTLMHYFCSLSCGKQAISEISRNVGQVPTESLSCPWCASVDLHHKYHLCMDQSREISLDYKRLQLTRARCYLFLDETLKSLWLTAYLRSLALEEN